MSGVTISYDVFDTVVTRAFAHPRDVFVHLGTRLHAQGLPVPAAMDFARARWAAELAARQKSPWTEVLLADIYRELAARLHWDAATAATALATELAVESRHLHGIPPLRAELAETRKTAGRVLFLSDMYLPSAVLGDWLTREGIMRPGDRLFVSGEARANKNSGQLFRLVREQTGGDFARWHHGGDHPTADVAKPRELGLTATHRPAAILTAREKLARSTRGEFAEEWRSLLAGAMRLARLERTFAREHDTVLWEVGTGVAGPLFYGFVRWTLAEARRRGLRRLYFLARDGQIFWRIAQAIQKAEPSPIECHYLQASRLLFAGPAELNSPAALRILAAPTGLFHSVRQTLASLGWDETWGRAHLPPRFRDTDYDANLPPAERDTLADWLLAPEQRPALELALTERRQQARAYLHATGVRAGEPIAVVDTGWFGTIQRSLEHILGEPAAPAPLTGFYLGLMPRGQTAPVGETLGYTNQFGPLPLLREESHKVLVELMAQSDQGQAARLVQNNGRWDVACQPVGPVDLAAIRSFQEAVLTFTGRMLAVAAETTFPDGDFDRAVIALYRDFHDRPTRREVRVFGFLPHSDQYYEQHHATLCADLDAPAIRRAILDYRQRPPHWWVQGQATLGHGWLLNSFRLLKKLWWQLRGRSA